jgi:hypothetical protein
LPPAPKRQTGIAYPSKNTFYFQPGDCTSSPGGGSLTFGYNCVTTWLAAGRNRSIPATNALAGSTSQSHFSIMNFPPFWARGRIGDFVAWRWSNQSQADAQARADQAAQQLKERCSRREHLPQHGEYYPNRPFREQLLQEFKDAAGAVTAAITRNSYGCQVLNTARVMFVDIDLPEPPQPGFFARMFGKPVPKNTESAELQAARIRIESWSRQHPDWGWRLYRTRAGLRLLATHDVVAPDSEISDTIFADLGADPLYRKLCQSQKCFRARLTPKPWRCGWHGRPARWPWLDAKQEKQFQKWEAQYQSHASQWATCQLLQKLGNPDPHPEIAAIITLHDNATRAESGLPLA